MKNRVYLLFGIMVLSFLLTGISANAKKKQIGKFTYTYKKIDTKSCSLSKITIDYKDRNFSTLTIPSKIDGLRVTSITTADKKNIFGRFSNCEGYTEGPIMERVKKIVLPDTLEKIESTCFHYIDNLQVVVVGAKLREGAKYIKSPTYKVSISSKNKWFKVKNGILLSKDGKTVYGPASARKDIVIPQGAKTIVHDAFNRLCNLATTQYNSIYIPSTVNAIKRGSLSANAGTTIKISKKNKRYGLSGDCLYSKKTGRLVAMMNRNDTLIVSKKVTNITNNYSIIGDGFQSIVIPSTIKKIKFSSLSCMTKLGDASIQFKGIKPPKIEPDIMFITLLGKKIFVPKAGYEEYKKLLAKRSCTVEIRD